LLPEDHTLTTGTHHNMNLHRNSDIREKNEKKNVKSKLNYETKLQLNTMTINTFSHRPKILHH